MDNRDKQAGEERDSWPDEVSAVSRETGNIDPYLAGLARKSRRHAADETCSTPFESRGWTGEDRRSTQIDSFDPYVVELARRNRSDV